MILNRTSAPATPIVSTSDAKAHLRVDTSDDDTYIAGLVGVATAVLDGPYGRVGKALITQTWAYSMWPVCGRYAVRFPVVPLQSISSMAYFDADNVSQSLTVGDFTVYSDEDTAEIVPGIGTYWPVMYDRPDALTITAVCGFGDAPSDLPENIVHAAKLIIGAYYEGREAVTGGQMMPLPMGVDALVNVSRVGWVG